MTGITQRGQDANGVGEMAGSLVGARKLEFEPPNIRRGIGSGFTRGNCGGRVEHLERDAFANMVWICGVGSQTVTRIKRRLLLRRGCVRAQQQQKSDENYGSPPRHQEYRTNSTGKETSIAAKSGP